MGWEEDRKWVKRGRINQVVTSQLEDALAVPRTHKHSCKVSYKFLMLAIYLLIFLFADNHVSITDILEMF